MLRISLVSTVVSTAVLVATLASAESELIVAVGKDTAQAKDFVTRLEASKAGAIAELTLPAFNALGVVGDHKEMDVELSEPAPGFDIAIYRAEDKAGFILCATYPLPPAGMTLAVEQVRCGAKGEDLRGGLLAVVQGDKTLPVARIEHRKRVPINAGDDLGVALNILNRDRDEQGFRFFEGASAYYSLSNIKTTRFRVIAALAALDFDDELDFETGLSAGLLFKPQSVTREDGSGFTLSVSRGYNFMANRAKEGWYTLIGFGWSFGRGES